MLAGFDVELTYVARTARDGVRPTAELPELLPHADVVDPHRARSRRRRPAWSTPRFLAAMPDGALLVNAARGVVVDTDALLAELTSRPAAGRPRRHRPRAAAGGAPALVGAGLLLTPHVGGAVPDTNDARGRGGHRPARPRPGRRAAGQRGRPLLSRGAASDRARAYDRGSSDRPSTARPLT